MGLNLVAVVSHELHSMTFVFYHFLFFKCQRFYSESGSSFERQSIIGCNCLFSKRVVVMIVCSFKLTLLVLIFKVQYFHTWFLHFSNVVILNCKVDVSLSTVVVAVVVIIIAVAVEILFNTKIVVTVI